MENTVYRRGIGLDHEWHPWAELSEEERKLWSDPMSRADLKHEYKKYHGDTMSYRQKVIEQEKDRGVHGIF